MCIEIIHIKAPPIISKTWITLGGHFHLAKYLLESLPCN